MDKLGDLLFDQDRRGNLGEARREVEGELIAAQQNSDSSCVPLALLNCGLIAQLQGNIEKSIQYLDECCQNAETYPNIQLMAAANAWRSTTRNWNYFPHGGSGWSLDSKASFDLEADTNRREIQIKDIRAHVNDVSFRMEYHIMLALNLTQVTRYLICLQYGPDRSLLLESIAKVQDMYRRVRDRADPITTAALEIDLADILFHSGEQGLDPEALKRADTIYNKIEDDVGRANCLVKRGDWIVAPFTCPEVWNTAMVEPAWNDEVHWTVESKEFDTVNADTDSARSFYEEAQALYDKSGALRGQAAIQLRLGYLATLEAASAMDLRESISCYTKAENFIEKACAMCEEAEDWFANYTARAQLALCRIACEQKPEDVTIAVEIGTWGRTVGSFSFAQGIGVFFNRIGRRWIVRDGSYERALACHRLSAALFKELGASYSYVLSLSAQKDIYDNIGQHADFTIVSDRILDDCTSCMRSSSFLAPHVLLFAKRVAIGMHLEAIKHAKNEPQILADVASRIRSLQTLRAGNTNATLGVFAMSQDDTPDEFDILDERLNECIGTANFLVPLYAGEQAWARGETEKAHKFFDQAAESLVEKGKKSHIDFDLATLHSYRRQNEIAINYTKQFIERRLADAEALENPLLKSDDLGRAYVEAMSCLSLREKFQEAEYYLKLLEALNENWWTLDTYGHPWENLNEVAKIQEGLGQLEMAYSTCEKAMTIYEQQRSRLSADEAKLAFASGSATQRLYFRAMRVAINASQTLADSGSHLAKNGLRRAFQAIERGKARGLLELMADAFHVSGLEVDTTSQLWRWKHLSAYLATRRQLLAQHLSQQSPSQQDKDQITLLRQQISQAEEEIQVNEAETTQSDSSSRRIQGADPMVLSLDEVIKVLPDDVAILQVAFLDKQLYSWLITGQNEPLVHHASYSEGLLDRNIHEFHRHCQGTRHPDSLAQWLSEVFLQPFENEIASHERLILVPYGSAYLLPFHALPFRGRPLGSSHTITFLPSTSMIRYITFDHHPSIAKGTLAIGNPSHMSYRASSTDDLHQLKDLPAAELEAIVISHLMPNSKALIRDQATKSLIQASISNHSILHFATHGRLVPSCPLLSEVLLANGDRLAVYELMGLRLNADLVVLSACQSGRGHINAADDVVGLSRALLAAGARAVLVSLWPVDSFSSMLLMWLFYGGLARGITAPVALREAQERLRVTGKKELVEELEQDSRGWGFDCGVLEVERNRTGRVRLLPEYSHPKYWAPFVLISV